MIRLSIDRLVSALRQVGLHKEYGMAVIHENRPPIFDYLLAANLITTINPDKNRPNYSAWILTDAGSEELKRLNNRIKWHLLLLFFSSVAVGPCAAALYHLAASRLPFSIPSTLFDCLGYLGFFGLLSFVDQLDNYLDDFVVRNGVKTAANIFALFLFIGVLFALYLSP